VDNAYSEAQHNGDDDANRTSTDSVSSVRNWRSSMGWVSHLDHLRDGRSSRLPHRIGWCLSRYLSLQQEKSSKWHITIGAPSAQQLDLYRSVSLGSIRPVNE